MPLRDHPPFVIETFGGFWARGDDESCPADHFTVADNIKFFYSGFETRDPLDKFQTTTPLRNIQRIYNYVMQGGQSLLVLTKTGTVGNIYHLVGPSTVYGPILTIDGMEDFGFIAIAGRAYITPFKTFTNANGQNYELGMPGQFLYVYNGDFNTTGLGARRAAGSPPKLVDTSTDGPMIATDGAAGRTDTGIHLIAVVYETDSGYITALGPQTFTQHTFTGINKIDISNIPISPDTYIKKRHLVSTKAIPEYNGDQKGYQFFFIPKGEIPNNTATTHTIEFFDSDLLSDASHLIDNFAEIPAGVSLCTYHSRMVLVGDGSPNLTEAGAVDVKNPDNRSVARVSMPGEPEAINKIDGLIIAPLDGNPLTNCQEFRDILYLFKRTRTYAYSDNRDEPATWQEEVIDQGVGAGVHGIGTVLDSGGVNIDFLLIVDWSGLMIFNGVYARPELSWKIEDYWLGLNRNDFRFIQIANDSLEKHIYITLPPPHQNFVLHADYGEGLNAKDVSWARWVFNAKMSSVCLTETNKVIFGARSE